MDCVILVVTTFYKLFEVITHHDLLNDLRLNIFTFIIIFLVYKYYLHSNHILLLRFFADMQLTHERCSFKSTYSSDSEYDMSDVADDKDDGE